MAYADTSLTELEFDEKLVNFVTLTKSLRGQLSEEFKTLLLERGLNDPLAKDPYQKLPHNAQQRFGRTKVSYRWDGESPTGVSGYYSLSVSPSSSPSTSPSSSASPSPEDTEAIATAVEIVEKADESKEKGDVSN